jgi:membrane dipeptidase
MIYFKTAIASLLVLIGITACINKKDTTLQLHRKIYVVDTHTDTPMKMVNGGFDLAARNNSPDSRVDIPRMKDGGVDAIFFALFTGQRERNTANYNHAYALANQMLDSIHAASERNSNDIGIATNSANIMEFTKKKKTAIYIGMENGFPLAKEINRVEEFYNKGVRYITLCHSQNNDLCDSSTDPKGAEHDGLSAFGHEVVAEMNRLGMMVDVSHISDKAFFDVMNVTKAPVIASHSSVRSVCEHPRNMSDDMIRALAQNGGVIQICILGAYISPEDTTSLNHRKLEELRLKYNNWNYSSEEERKEAWAAWDSINKHYPPVLPTISDAINHIDYVKKLVGSDYVGIGSDFDGGGGLADCADVADFPKITAELSRRGYSDDEIAKIWGGNVLRVYQSVEKMRDKKRLP